MSNNANAQAQLDNLRNVASQLKEMRHYAQSNTETLSAHWLAFDQGVQNKAFAEAINDLLNKQEPAWKGWKTIQDIEIELNRLDKAA